MTPGELATHLGVQERTLRRFSAAYEAVHGPLPRDARGHRVFPADAVGRLSGAVPVLRERPAVGLEAVLRGQAVGNVAAPAVAPAMVGNDVLDAVQLLRLEVQNLTREVAALRERLEDQPDTRPDIRTPTGQPVDRAPATTVDAPHQLTAQPAPTLTASITPDADQLRDLEAGTVLRVTDTSLPSRLKNEMRWNAARYEALEAVLRGTQAVTLHRTNGKFSWRTDSGETMRRETVGRLLGAGVLKIG